MKYFVLSYSNNDINEINYEYCCYIVNEIRLDITKKYKYVQLNKSGDAIKTVIDITRKIYSKHDYIIVIDNSKYNFIDWNNINEKCFSNYKMCGRIHHTNNDIGPAIDFSKFIINTSLLKDSDFDLMYCTKNGSINFGYMSYFICSNYTDIKDCNIKFIKNSINTNILI